MSLRRTVTRLLLTAALAASPPTARAEDFGPAGSDSLSIRPRIGLVLSGGGARGAAHIGVLRVLEELHVPVDFVAGTSMGSIIGGLYASGMGPDEMERAIAGIDWAGVFDDAPPRRDRPFRRKEEDHVPLFQFELGWNGGGFSLPSGLIAGQKLDFILRDLTLPVYTVSDFDLLPVPFRAVAADLADGEAVVLGEGDLTMAMRASMAIPGAFTPVNLDGRLLVDGGMAMNLPVKVVKDLGADLVIAVDVGTPAGELEPDQNLLGVVLRTLDLLSKKNVAEQKALLGPGDLLLVPDMGPVTTAGFDRLTESVRRGEETARAHAFELLAFAVSEDEYAAHRAARRKPGRPRPVVDEIVLDGFSRIPEAMVRSRLRTQVGDTLRAERLQDELDEIYRIGEVSRVDARLERRGEGNALIYSAQEKSWGPTYIRLGLALESNLDGEGDFTLLVNHRRAFVNRYGGEWRNRLALGSRQGITTDFHQPLDRRGRWFVNPILFNERTRRDVFIAPDLRLPFKENRSVTILAFGRNLGHFGEIRAAYSRGFVRLAEQLTVEAEPLTRQQGVAHLRLTVDKLDHVFLPRSGAYLVASLDLMRKDLGGEDDYDLASLELRQAFPLGSGTVLLRGRVTGDLGSEIPFWDQPRLGGFSGMAGLEKDELQGDNTVFGSVTVHRRLGGPSPVAGRGLYVGASLETGAAAPLMSGITLDTMRLGATAFLGVDTLLGPFFLGWGWADRGRTAAYLVLGLPY
ncbi:MAG: patatin-like phospholipase family protein [Candidatus Krumholzibacteriia bacterium]